ncbi:MAG: HD domain-containing protein [Alphaproteobacteria bacterium]|nr:HD domain-containing protein [Alphaproteobacteria bacterium]
MDLACPVSFGGRSAEDRRYAVMRPFREQLDVEVSGSGYPFLDDLTAILRCRELHRLQGQQQLSVAPSYDVRSRLAHTGDVGVVGELIARELGLDQNSSDLVRAIASIHDIGHMPFNHCGEQAANALFEAHGMKWTHDAAGLRVINEWSNRGLSYPGLNLSLDILEGLAKRYWRYPGAGPYDRYNHDLAELPPSILEINEKYTRCLPGEKPIQGLHLDEQNHIEGQIAAIADWIAFTATDIADGLRSGIMRVDAVKSSFPRAAKLYGDAAEQLREYRQRLEKYPAEERHARYGLKRDTGARTASIGSLMTTQITNMLIADVVAQTKANIKKEINAGNLRHGDDVRKLPHLLVAFSPEMQQEVEQFGAYCKKVFAPLDVPLAEAVELTIKDIVSGAMKLPAGWGQEQQRLRNAEDMEKKEPALLELACAYLTCVANDGDVLRHIKENHQEFWHNNLEKHVICKPISPVLPADVKGEYRSGPGR